jgi:hypothetical protein
MYTAFPSLILRAAMVRAHSLELGGMNDYYTSSSAPSSSTLVAAAPSATNVYVLAFGEREGLAPGERLEVYGGNVRLVRTLAYGCPRGVTVQSAFTGRLSAEDLNGITEQLDELHACGNDMRKLITLQPQRRVSSSSAAAAAAAVSTSPSLSSAATFTSSSSGSAGAPHRWTLRLPEIKHSRVLRSSLPDDAAITLSGEQLTAQLERMRRSPEEVVVAEWLSFPSEEAARRRQEQTTTTSDGSGGGGGGGLSNTVALTDENGIPLSSLKTVKPGSGGRSSRGGGDAGGDGNANDALLMENGVCFRSADSCGLRALRTARLAFISSIERTANGLARRQRRLSGEELRALEVLDVNAIDFTFTHAALQSTLELGLHTGEACRITHVPLTDVAAQQVEAQAASYVRIVGAGAGRALPRPFDYLPTHSFDVGAYTAYLPLPLGPLSKAEAAGSEADVDLDDASSSSSEAAGARTAAQPGRSPSSPPPKGASGRGTVSRGTAAAAAAIGGTRLDRQQLAMQLSLAMATLRRGACMLVTFVPTPQTVAALYHAMEAQHHAEVLIERHMVVNSKACIAEAIARTGRWGYVTDEVLPAVDSPQGSAFSLMVVLE